MVASRPSVLWHYVLISLLLIVIVSFFYLRHRLVQRIDRDIIRFQSVLDSTPPKQISARNLRRWHDSSLIFATIKDFQAENNGDFPKRWDDELLNARNTALAGSRDITIQSASDKGLTVDNLPDLPNEDYFHIWPGASVSKISGQATGKTREN